MFVLFYSFVRRYFSSTKNDAFDAGLLQFFFIPFKFCLAKVKDATAEFNWFGSVWSYWISVIGFNRRSIRRKQLACLVAYYTPKTNSQTPQIYIFFCYYRLCESLGLPLSCCISILRIQYFSIHIYCICRYSDYIYHIKL